MDNSKKRIIVMSIQNGPITSLSQCITLMTLLIAAINFRPVESKSMPINQLPFQLQPSQQMLPSKIPMIFLSKPQQQQQQQQQYQSQQDFRQTPMASGASISQQSINLTNGPQQLAKSQQVAAAAAAAASQAQQVASSASNDQQKPEMIQTSASYVNEISAPQPSQVSTRIQYRQPRQQQSKLSPVPIQANDQLIKASATQQQSNIAEADDGDSDSNDGEMDMNDEPEPASQAIGNGKMNPNGGQSQSEEGPTRRRSSSSGPSAALASSSSRLATIESVTRQRYNGPHTLPYHANDHRDQLPEGQAQGDDSAAIRKEQENAEASEAEVADRSALDEQQQAQREIILAQAQSEAKAIKEQQESLMKQQALQQQMIMRRQNELDDRNNRSLVGNGNRAGALPSSDRRSQQHKLSSNSNSQQLKKQRAQRQQNYLDDQAAEERRGYEGFVSKNTNQDEDADYSFRRPLAIARHPSSSSSSSGSIPKYGVNDLLPAAQHSYGAHYAPLHDYQKDYYQFAESFKKGQFHSGFKRGGNKFQISGHASQHKSHAEGHVKWNGYKGKGVSYWNYQHGDKKHYGDSHGGHSGYYH